MKNNERTFQQEIEYLRKHIIVAKRLVDDKKIYLSSILIELLYLVDDVEEAYKREINQLKNEKEL